MNFWQGLGAFFSSFGRGFRIAYGRSSPPIDRSDSSAGIVVTHEKALTLSTVWACVGLKSEVCGSMPCMTYYVDAEGRKKPAVDHELFWLLHEQPNANMSAQELWGMLFASRELWGNGYAVKRTIGSRVVSVDPWLPQYVTPYIEKESGLVRYKYEDGLDREDHPATDVIHIKGMSLDGLVGLSPLEAQRHSLGRTLATEEVAGKLFKNGMMPSTVFTYPHLLTPKQRKSFRVALRKFTGAANSGQPFILEKGMEMKGLSMKPVDAEFLFSRNFNVEDICRWYRTPPPLVGHTDKASSWASSLEGMKQGYLDLNLAPTLVNAELAVKRALVRPEERRKLVIKFDTKALLRADSAGRAALYTSGSQNGWMTRNEIRQREDLEPMQGGDELTAQSNLLPLDQLGQQQQQASRVAADAIKAWLGIDVQERKRETDKA